MRSILLLLALLAGLARGEPTVQITGDLLTVRAHKVPLRDLLTAFARAGVEVKLDPSIDELVTGSCTNMDMSDALDALLKPYGYAVTWDVLPGPVGDLRRLSEIRVFRPGHPREVRPLAPANPNFQIARDGATGPEFVVDEILLGLRPGTRADALRALLGRIGGTVVASSSTLGIYLVRLPPNSNVMAAVRQLQSDPLVAAVEPNYVTRLPAPQPGSATGSGEPLSPRPASGARAVAVLDSGLQPLDRLADAVTGSYDAISPGRALADPAGHGTQMALVVSGAVAPTGQAADETGVPVLAIRTFDENGITSNFALMRALSYAADEGAGVVNLSWGSSTPSDFMATAVRRAQDQGMIVVAAAGNEPTGEPMYPAAYPGVVSVSALDAGGQPWTSSNHGSTVELAAPGYATMPVGHDGPPGTYAGTSIASAYVARELALYLQQHPGATAAQATSALLASVQGSPLPDARYGQGALDQAAVDRLRAGASR